MASHRKPRSTAPLAGLRTAPALAPAVGVTTAALTSVALLASSAQAVPAKPRPSIEEVQKQVDGLYHQAGVATEKYNAAKEHTAAQRKHVDDLLDDVAERTEKLNSARQELGSFAAAQYRTGGVSGTATLLLADDPQQYFDDDHLMSRLTNRQKVAVDDFQKQQATTAKKRTEAAENLTDLTHSQTTLRKAKDDVQEKLGTARSLLSKLSAEQKARLAAIEQQKREAAERRAKELAAQQAAAEKEREQSGNAGSGGTASGSHSTMAAKAIAFAKAQLGKPYVWGATGPDSFDCSGLVQAAWKTAGVSLPRTTWDQVKVGTTVSSSEAEPGDLVFYFSDISHVGIYIGDGNVIDAPRPGKTVETIPMTYMPIYSVVRPA